MKTLAYTLLATLALNAVVAAQELPVGATANDVSFALLEDGLSNTQLSDFSGQIVALYYYTPW